MPCARRSRSSRRYCTKPPGVWRLSILAGVVARVREPVDDVRRREDVRAGSRVDDLVADVELELALEDVERVAVALVEVGVDAASRVERDLEQRELGRSALTGPRRGQRDRLVHSDRLLDEAEPLVGASRDEHPLLHHSSHAGVERLAPARALLACASVSLTVSPPSFQCPATTLPFSRFRHGIPNIFDSWSGCLR